MQVAALKKIKDTQAKNFAQLKVTSKAANNDSFTATMLNYQLSSLMNRKEQVEKNISQT